MCFARNNVVFHIVAAKNVCSVGGRNIILQEKFEGLLLTKNTMRTFCAGDSQTNLNNTAMCVSGQHFPPL